MNLVAEIRKIVNDVKQNEPMSKNTSFCIGGPAEVFVKVANIKQLQGIIKYSNSKKIPLCILGKGTNMLVKDKGIRGIVLKLNGDFNQIEFANDTVTAGAAVDLPVLASKSFARELSGLEFAVGIPGSVGGAAITNAGAYGESIGNIIDEITIMDFEGKMHTLKKDEVRFEYRSSFLAVEGVLLNIRLKLQPKNKNDIIKEMQSYIEKRKKTQGIKFPNAGCIFKNIESSNTGKLIEEAGLKGFRVGGAQVSVKHANYIVNLGGATAEDVLGLIEEVRTKIKDKFGIMFELEIKVVGE